MTSSVLSRRVLLARGGAALGLAALGRPVAAAPVCRAARRQLPLALFADPVGAATLKALAIDAIQSARDAGATYADIRIGEQRTFSTETQGRGYTFSTTVGYGVRALVDGVWGFRHGTLLTRDSVVDAGRAAAQAALRESRLNHALGGERVELSPTRSVKGEWTTPVRLDPFAVPIDDHLRWLDTLESTTETLFKIKTFCVFEWIEETRVFASTEDSLVTQQFTRSRNVAGVSAALPDEGIQLTLGVPSVFPSSGGYEVVLRPAFVDDIARTADRAMWLSSIPVRSFHDVGRYSVVLDGGAMATLIAQTINQAVEGDRVLGFEADAAGTTFLAPAAQMLGRSAQLSPLVTIRSDWELPAFTAAKWDDEGVPAGSHTLIDRGVVTAYHTTRETAAALDTDVAPALRVGRSRGRCLVAKPSDMPMPLGGNVVMQPAPTVMSLETLCRDIHHGFLQYDAYITPEPGLTMARSNGAFLELKRGQPVARIMNVGLQFETRKMLQSALLALGDPSTSGTRQTYTSKGMPWQQSMQMGTAPAALFKDIDLFLTDVS